MSLKSVKAWLITDGKAGDEQQCIGILQALGLKYRKIHVKPRWFYSLFMPHGPIDAKDNPGISSSLIAPPFPDIAIASGRRSVAYLKKIKTVSKGRCFTVFLKNPRTGCNAADFIWVPEHDGLRGENILVTLTSPNLLTASTLKNASQTSMFSQIDYPRVAVLLGGESSLYTYTRNDSSALADALLDLANSGAGLMVTPSRRTSALLYKTVENTVKAAGGFFWGGTGKNPLTDMLSAADHIIVTADSVNMVGEAVSTGKPVHIFYPSKRFNVLNLFKFKPHKIEYFLVRLTNLGVIRPLEKKLESWSYEPINATPVIAAEIEKRYMAYQDKISGEN